MWTACYKKLILTCVYDNITGCSASLWDGAAVIGSVTTMWPGTPHRPMALWTMIMDARAVWRVQRFNVEVGQSILNPLAADIFLLPSNWHEDNFLHTVTWHRVYFSMLTVWHGLFSLVLMFPGLKMKDLPISTAQGKCRYTIFKRRTRKFHFRSYVLNLVQINISRIERADLLAIPAIIPFFRWIYHSTAAKGLKLSTKLLL